MAPRASFRWYVSPSLTIAKDFSILRSASSFSTTSKHAAHKTRSATRASPRLQLRPALVAGYPSTQPSIALRCAALQYHHKPIFRVSDYCLRVQ